MNAERVAKWLWRLLAVIGILCWLYAIIRMIIEPGYAAVFFRPWF